jgi:class 3 adenylate cyclase/tetratricopeptide (TPR) repeat protein
MRNAVDIAAWLRELGLERYEQAFRDNAIDAEVLPELTDADLEKLAVLLGHRKKLLKAIADLGDGTGIVVRASGKLTLPHPAGATIAAGERRQVTVLFADLCGFSRLSRERDAEEMHALLNRYFSAVDGVVQSYGGTVDKHIGDAVMAVFGAPVAHGNDPERAVHAALEIHRAVATLEPPLESHIGLASGQVVASETGSETHQEYTVTGESVNLAARLQDLAGPGETLVSDALVTGLAGRLDATPLDEVAVDGWDSPVRVWHLDGIKTEGTGSARHLFVGRRAELAQFKGVLAACREAGTGQTVYVRGEAGIGKTRLVDEFQALAEAVGFACHTGLVLDFGTGKGQDAIRSVVRSLLGIAPGAVKELRQAATDQAIAEGLLDEEHRPYVNDLLDLNQPVALRSLYDAMDNAARNAGKRATVAKLVRRTSATKPLLVRIEDVQWADQLVLDYLTALSRTVVDCPAVLVATSRIEGDPLDQAWRWKTAGASLVTVDLGPLCVADAETLAADYGSTSDTFLAACVSRAGGNPLFLDQLLRGASEALESALPGSVQSVVQARLDALAPADKEALRAASVMGQRFTLAALQSVTCDPDYSCARLIQHGLVRPEGEGYLFAHALVRDAVYGSLLAERRRELHRRTAAWFAEQDPVLHAEHLDKGGDEAAAMAYLTAGRVQAESYHNARALELVMRGREIATERDDRFALTLYLGELLLSDGRNDESMAVMQEAHELADSNAERCKALIGLAAGLRLADDLEGAWQCLDEAESMAQGTGFDHDLSRLHHLRGNLCFPLGKVEDCRREHQQALAYARMVGSVDLEAQALGGIGDAEYARGHLVSAQEYCAQCISISRAHGLGAIEAAHAPMMGGGGTLFYCNDLSEALKVNHRGIEMGELTGHHRAILQSSIGAAQIMIDRCQPDQALQYIERVMEIADRFGLRRFEARALGLRAKVSLERGNRAEAAVQARRAREISQETGPKYCGPAVTAVLIRATGNPDEAAEAIEQAERLLAEGCVSHNYFEYYIEMIEHALEERHWDDVERRCRALEDYTRSEPLPRTDYFVARGRALAALGRGQRNETTARELQRLRDEGARIGLAIALPAIDKALASF